MCGICGIIQLGADPAPIDTGVLDRMVDVLAHRGPDGRGTWYSADSRAGLGHRRLAIVDLSPLGAQPMTNEDGTVWVTFNGEIYNFPELRRRLEQRGHVFRSHTDTEVLVHLYEDRGEAMLDDLDGDFAFALWDARQRTALLARDPVGVKPLYTAERNGVLLFASEIKSLLEHPLIEPRMSQEGFYHYLTYLVVPAPHTMFEGIRKLRAGEALKVEADGRVRRWRYWTAAPRHRNGSPADLDAEFEELFRASVKKRMMSDVPVGLLFSGGVDSTLNALAFQELVAPSPVSSYNVAMNARRFAVESEHAELIAGAMGLRHARVDLEEEDFQRVMSDVTWHLDEPLADPVTVAQWYVTRLARQGGMTVLHAGEGADELFCGYDITRRFLRHDRWLWQPLRRLPRAVSAMGYRMLRGGASPRTMKIADVLRRRSLGQAFYMAEAIGFYEHEKSRLLAPAFLEEMEEHDSYFEVEPIYRELAAEAPEASFIDQITYIELTTRLPELLLMRTDKMAMANSIEARVPFLDKALIEFALSAPLSWKTRNGVSKEPLKRLATEWTRKAVDPARLGRDPAQLFYRPKSGFGAPIQEWFSGGLGRDLSSRLMAQRDRWEGIVDVAAITRELAAGPANENRSFQLWTLYMALVWRERFGV
jgi:asparagine synthase (glutamine-hydrolysing)